MTRPIQTALASFGMSGTVFHGPLLKANPLFNVKTIVQRSSNSALDVFPKARIVRTFEELLCDSDLDLIIVNTPDNMHFQQAKMALEAGKHVVVEKPFVQSVEQGEELISIAENKDVILSVFHNRRWDNGFLTAKRIISEKLLGRLVEYEVRYDRFRNNIQESWKETPSYGTGILHNLGSHLIDQALILFGMPYGVECDLFAMRDGSMVDDFFDLRLKYNDFSVTLKSSYLVKESGPVFVLHGTEGSYVKHGMDPQEHSLKQGHKPGGENWGVEPKSEWGILNTQLNGIQFRGVIETIPGNYAAFYDNIYRTITKKEPLAVTPQQALDVIRIIEASILSNTKKRLILL